MKSAISSFIAYLIFIGSALAAEPVDNILPFQLLDDNSQIIAEMKIYEVSRQSTGELKFHRNQSATIMQPCVAACQ